MKGAVVLAVTITAMQIMLRNLQMSQLSKI